MKFQLICVSENSPERYDIYLEKELVGDMILADSRFTVCHHTEGKVFWCHEIVFEATPAGINKFEDYEREIYLMNACRAIRDKILSKQNPEIYEIVKEI